MVKTHRKQEYKRAVDARGSNTSVPSLSLGAEGSNGVLELPSRVSTSLWCITENDRQIAELSWR